MNNLCRSLNFPVTIVDFFDREKYSKNRHYLLDIFDISKDYTNFIESLGLKILRIEVFYTLPNVFYKIHKDHQDLNDFSKINFVYGGKNSVMNWYKPKEEKTGTKELTQANASFFSYDKENVELVFKTNIKSPSLIQSGVPHNVTSEDYRWCISTAYQKDKKILSWQDAVEIFDSYFCD